MATPGPNATDDLTLTLSEGITLTVAELSPYGGTLTETGSKDGSDTGTLAESGSGTTLTASSDTASLDDTGVIIASQLWLTDTDAGTLDDVGVAQATAEWFTGADDGTLTDTGNAVNPAPTADDTGTLAEGITLTAATLSPYGGTLSEVEGFVWTGTDTGTLDDSDAYFGTPKTGADTGTLSESGAVTESNSPSDAGDFNDDVTTVVVDDLVAEGTLTDTTASLTAVVRGTDTGTLSETTQLSTSVGTVTADDEDTLTLAEAVVLTVLAVTSEDGTLAEGSALLLTPTDTVTISEATALTILATGTDTGTLSDTGSTTIIFPGGAILVTVTATDTVTLSESGVLLANVFFGKPLGTVTVAPLATAVVTVRRLVLGSGDL